MRKYSKSLGLLMVVGLLFVGSVTAQIPTNLSTIRASQITDAQLMQFLQQAQSSGMTEEQLIQEFKRRFTSLKSNWGQAFMDIKANHLLVVKDLKVLHSSATTLASQLGSLTTSDQLGQGSTVWSALSNFARTATDHSTALLSVSESNQAMQQDIAELSEMQETLHT